MEDATPILERQMDDQDDIETKGTTEHPIQENKPKRKPNIKKPQGGKGKRSILSILFFFFKEKHFQGAWVAQLIKHPTSVQVMISQFVSLSPASGSVLTA